MPKYKVNTIKHSVDSACNSGYDSGYESDGGTEYSPVTHLGAGEYAKARLFKATSNKTVAVLNPVDVPGDLDEARIKHRFFQTIYPTQRSHLFIIETDYRLVVPYIEYVSYQKLTVDTPELQKTIFLSAIEALKYAHDKNIIVLDLKIDNIYYDSSTKKSYLIDGGFSVLTGEPIDPAVFQKPSKKIVEECKKDYTQIAPECWSITPIAVLATPKMDVYCLGRLMKRTIDNPISEIQSLIDSCLEQDPEKRPTLVALINSLKSIIYTGICPNSSVRQA